MSTAAHYVLVSKASLAGDGRWSFALRSADGSNRLEAADSEPAARGQRLELLAVVRGLEALDQPSRVTVMTPSQYVRRGIAYGLEEWRANGWTWEHYGQMVQVKNHDLWQRLDRAMNIHQVQCRQWRFDGANAHGPAKPAWTSRPAAAPAAKPKAAAARVAFAMRLRQMLARLFYRAPRASATNMGMA